MSTRARTTDETWKRTVVLGATKSSVQLYPEVEFHTQSRRVIVAVSQRTLPIMLLINEKKKMQKKKKKTKYGIATANRISS